MDRSFLKGIRTKRRGRTSMRSESGTGIPLKERLRHAPCGACFQRRPPIEISCFDSDSYRIATLNCCSVLWFDQFLIFLLVVGQCTTRFRHGKRFNPSHGVGAPCRATLSDVGRTSSTVLWSKLPVSYGQQPKRIGAFQLLAVSATRPTFHQRAWCAGRAALLNSAWRSGWSFTRH